MPQGELRLMIYEVHNTFGGRHSYVAEADRRGLAQQAFAMAEKVFRVSPFNGVEGSLWPARLPARRDPVARRFPHHDEGPILKAYFQGHAPAPVISGPCWAVLPACPSSP